MTTAIQTVQSSVPSIQSWDELMRISDFFAKSKLIPVALQGKPADVAIILQQGWELGIPPIQAINGINVIQGKPSISPELGLALAYSKIPGFWCEYSNTSETSCTVTMGRDKNNHARCFTATWDMKKAQSMGLTGKDNYRKQPGVMLKWRATMEALRVIAPDVLRGMYSDDEAQDFGGEEKPVNKIDRLKSLAKKVELEVKAEVVNPETGEITEPSGPTVHPEPQLEPQPDMFQSEQPPLMTEGAPGHPLDQTVIMVGTKYKGQTFAQVGREELERFAEDTKAWFEKENKKKSAAWLEFFELAAEYCGKNFS